MVGAGVAEAADASSEISNAPKTGRAARRRRGRRELGWFTELLTGTPGNKTNGSLLLDRLPTKLSLHEVDLHTSDSSLSLFLR